MRIWAITTIGLFAVSAAQAQTAVPSPAEAAEYRTCIAEVDRNAERGFEHAIGWESLGGGDPARHCVAVALMRLGHHEVAARRLEELARVINADASVKADLLGQSGQAWLLAENSPAALAVLNAAINLDQRNPEIYADRAQAHAAGGDMVSAIEDLTRAIRLDPRFTDARVFRASAYRQTGETGLATQDVNQALEQDPTHPEALLERGILSGQAGDEAGARADWLRVIEMVPDSPAAKAAQTNLERMDGPARDGAASPKP